MVVTVLACICCCYYSYHYQTQISYLVTAIQFGGWRGSRLSSLKDRSATPYSNMYYVDSYNKEIFCGILKVFLSWCVCMNACFLMQNGLFLIFILNLQAGACVYWNSEHFKKSIWILHLAAIFIIQILWNFE